MADYDPRIVALYDGKNPDGPDHDYYRSLAVQPGVQRILDLGCGTGILTVTLAQEGREVVGMDPSPAMLDYARQRAGASEVLWVEGDSRALDHGLFDLAVMTGNVVQHIPDQQWERTLQDLRRSLSSGSVLAFESRNPERRAWESWAREEPCTRDTPFGPVTEWRQVQELSEGKILLESFSKFATTGATVHEDLVLAFRTVAQLDVQLQAAGFKVDAIWGDWNRTPFDGSQAVMIFEARAA